MSTEVKLYRYDISGGMAAQFSQALIGRHLQGIWHTSIVISGSEYYFDGGVGIVKELPGQTRFGTPLVTEVLGRTSKSLREFEDWNEKQLSSSKFGPTSYNLLNCNCNHYTQEASRFLLSKDIPSDVKDMIPTLLNTPLGAMIKPMLEMMSTAPGQHAASIGLPSFGSSANSNGAPDSRESVSLPPAMEEDIELYLTLIRTSEDHTKEKIMTCLDALERIISNIVTSPSNTQYQRISLSSQFYITKLSPFSASKDILSTIGFKPEETAGSHLIFKGKLAHLKSVLGHIKTAKNAMTK
eukprot:Tbor_TRINITY_DN5325_c3_g12::TRINITY_DN5325_c3_g12_i1::g.5038::m.5038